MSTDDEVDEISRLKQQAAEKAIIWIQSGMVVGLGSGSTAVFAIRRIGALVADGTLRNIVAVPTSQASEALARKLGIPLAPHDDLPPIDVTIDGADEVDGDLNLIKGGGGALLREKIVAQATRREIIVIDESKLSPKLGTTHALPVEVIPFAWRAQQRFLEGLRASVTLRLDADGRPYETDQGNLILDCRFGPLDNPIRLAEQLDARAGVVAHGLFLGLASDCIVASSGGLRHLQCGA